MGFVAKGREKDIQVKVQWLSNGLGVGAGLA